MGLAAHDGEADVAAGASRERLSCRVGRVVHNIVDCVDSVPLVHETGCCTRHIDGHHNEARLDVACWPRLLGVAHYVLRVN